MSIKRRPTVKKKKMDNGQNKSLREEEIQMRNNMKKMLNLKPGRIMQIITKRSCFDFF